MVIISQPPNGVDPILFLQGLLVGQIRDDSGTIVRITVVYPKEIQGITMPLIIINQKPEEMRFISIPALRRRWTTPFTLEIWAKSVEQRYAIKESLMARLDAITGPANQLADNYVYMWFKVNEPKDQQKKFGQPIFTIGFQVTLVYDTLTAQVPPL
jgi:hypothetical protein